jgi:hypothetical protein
MGLLLIACFAAGRGIDVFLRTGRFRAIWKDRSFRRFLLLIELCAAATLLNPYGLGVYTEVFQVARNRNVRDLIEWDPLTLRMIQGRIAAVAVLLLVAVYRWSPRRITASEVLALSVFGLGACWTSRIIVWWAPIAAFYLALHGAAVFRRFAQGPTLSPRSGLWTVATIGLVWIAFAYTPLGVRILHGPRTEEETARRFRRAVSQHTPVEIAEYLRARPPQGLVFNAYEWGDYLLWAGPVDIQCFVTSHVHLIPREVWEDYFRIAGAGVDWDRRLDRYGVNTVIVDHAQRRELIRGLKESPDVWQLAYEDRLGAVFVRKNPI